MEHDNDHTSNDHMSEAGADIIEAAAQIVDGARSAELGEDDGEEAGRASAPDRTQTASADGEPRHFPSGRRMRASVRSAHRRAERAARQTPADDDAAPRRAEASETQESAEPADAADDARTRAAAAAKNVTEHAAEGYAYLKGRVAEGYDGLKDRAAETVDNVKETTSRKTDEARSFAAEKAHAAGAYLSSKAASATSTASEVARGVASRISEASQAASAAVEEHDGAPAVAQVSSPTPSSDDVTSDEMRDSDDAPTAQTPADAPTAREPTKQEVDVDEGAQDEQPTAADTAGPATQDTDAGAAASREQDAAERPTSHATPRASSRSRRGGVLSGIGARLKVFYEDHLNAIFYGIAGVISAILILAIGFWRALLVIVLCAIGIAYGRYRDGDPSTVAFFRRLFR
ncbi:MAG: DUF2273 domain-containing protein [Coriobacteriales bacterium]